MGGMKRQVPQYRQKQQGMQSQGAQPAQMANMLRGMQGQAAGPAGTMPSQNLAGGSQQPSAQGPSPIQQQLMGNGTTGMQDRMEFSRSAVDPPQRQWQGNGTTDEIRFGVDQPLQQLQRAPSPADRQSPQQIQERPAYRGAIQNARQQGGGRDIFGGGQQQQQGRPMPLQMPNQMRRPNPMQNGQQAGAKGGGSPWANRTGQSPFGGGGQQAGSKSGGAKGGGGRPQIQPYRGTGAMR